MKVGLLPWCMKIPENSKLLSTVESRQHSEMNAVWKFLSGKSVRADSQKDCFRTHPNGEVLKKLRSVH